MQPPWSPPGSPYGPPAPAVPAGTPGSGSAPSASVIEAVRFAFSGDTMNNLLVGAVFGAIPIVGQIALEGWLCEAQQRLVRQHPQPLPKLSFTDLGHYLGRGVQVFLVALIAGVPIAMVFVMTYFMAGVVAALLVGATGEPLFAIAAAVAIGLMGVLMMLVFSAVLSGLTTRVELSESAGDALALKPVLAYARINWLRTLVKGIVFFFVAFALSVAGLLLCYFGVFLAAVVLRIAAMHLRFQLYQQYLADGGEPFPVKQPVLLPSEQYGLPTY